MRRFETMKFTPPLSRAFGPQEKQIRPPRGDFINEKLDRKDIA
jgi:hypothetical protein